jgi:transcriptional regulator with XRE-family HTH domain
MYALFERTKLISLVKTGRKMPSLKMLVSICDALSISLDEMVFGSQPGRKTDQAEWGRLLNDCSQYEKEILKDVAICVKASLREHNDIRR